MQRKLFVLFAGLVLLSLMIAPVGMAGAQGPIPPLPPPTPKPPFPGGEGGGPGGAQRGPDGLWYMPEGAKALAPNHPVVPLAKRRAAPMVAVQRIRSAPTKFIQFSCQ